MAYDKTRVNLTDAQHTAAKELNDLFEALVDRNGDVAKEAIEAVMAMLPIASSSRRERLQFLMKVLLANVADELGQRYID